MGAHWQKNMNVIAVVGPTASGKSALAIEIAKQFSGEIITVDSRTIYRGMDIGTAKPQGKPQADGSLLSEGIFHWGLDLVNPDEEYSAALFKISAEQKIQEIISRGNLPVLVGGTGLWFDVLLRGLELPKVEPNAELRKELEQKTIQELRQEYEQLDPQGISFIDTKNKRRLIRALEVSLQSFSMPKRNIYEQKTKNGVFYMFKYGHEDSKKLFEVLYSGLWGGLFLERKYRTFRDGFTISD